jgi:hypothetical protein
MTCNLTEEQTERWRQFKDQMEADESFIAQQQARDHRRLLVRQEILELLEDFQDGHISLEQLKNTFDQKTRSNWDVFGLKGMNGAMFLNMLVKHIPDQSELSKQLEQTLKLPSDESQGQQRMLDFYDYLNTMIESSQVTRRQIQPARTPFIISAWWHMQDVEHWPVYYPSGRQAFAQEHVYAETNHPMTDYFEFRECFLALSGDLALKSWDLEHLLVWYQERRSPIDTISTTDTTDGAPPVIAVGEEKEEETVETREEALNHTHIQWLLAKIGHRLGCRVWIASNDHKRTWQGERLGDLSMASLPAFWLDPEAQRIVGLIDVVWIKGHNQIAAAFEVEHTTSVYSGLLRMSDLTALSPNQNFPLYIVTPDARMDKVRRELSRPTFQALELHRQCGFFSFESLISQADAILTWASDPSAIDNLASRVPDVDG